MLIKYFFDSSILQGKFMEDKKYQIFISSTFTDLKDQREKIIKSILEIYHIPIGMEMFSADDEEQWETIKKTIDKSDYYVLILGLRYGSVTNDGISFTEKEYDYAINLKKPVLSFLLKEDAPLSQNDRDDDLVKINAFRKKVLSNDRMAKFWNDPNELSKEVSIALMNQFKANPQVGWLKADSLGLSKNVSEEIVKLNEEVRKLRQENESLKAKIPNRQVDLSLELNNQSSLSLTIPKVIDSERFIDMPQHITDHNLQEILENNQIDSDDFQYVSQEIIKKYNNQIPSQETIDKYNKSVECYEQWELALEFKFSISNNGTQKASHIIINIEFPDAVEVIDKDTKESKIPLLEDRPSLPNLNWLINNKKDEVRKRSNSLSLNPEIYKTFKSFEPDRSRILYPLQESYLDISSLRSPKIKGSYIDLLDTQNVELYRDKLLHTRCINFKDQFFLVPKKVGSFEIKATIISEEMSNPKIVTIPITINH